MNLAKFRAAIGNLTFTGLVQQTEKVPSWVADALASTIGPKIDDAIRSSRKLSSLLPAGITVALIAGAVATAELWRILFIVAAIGAFIWTLMIWLSWSASRRQAEKFFAVETPVSRQVASRLAGVIDLPDGAAAKVRWAWKLRDGAKLRGVVDVTITELATMAGEAGASPEQVAQLQQYLDARTRRRQAR